MAANENDLTQPKFELGIKGIIHDVFQGDQTTKQTKTKNRWKKINYFPREGNPSMEIINFFLKPSLMAYAYLLEVTLPQLPIFENLFPGLSHFFLHNIYPCFKHLVLITSTIYESEMFSCRVSP